MTRRAGWALPVLLVLVVALLGTLAAMLRGQAERAAGGAADNRAVIDGRASDEVVGEISAALEAVLSYDYTRLDETERAAADVITGGYLREYRSAFAGIRRTALAQRVVVRTTVVLAGVKQLGADRAELIATTSHDCFRDGERSSAPGRVAVVANRVDGRWKIVRMSML